MAIIGTYSSDAELVGEDKLLGTDSNSANATKNYTLNAISAFFNSATVPWRSSIVWSKRSHLRLRHCCCGVPPSSRSVTWKRVDGIWTDLSRSTRSYGRRGSIERHWIWQARTIPMRSKLWRRPRTWILQPRTTT